MSVCLELTETELNNLIAQGWLLEGGPFESESICLSNCGSGSSSSSSLSSGSGTGACFCPSACPNGVSYQWQMTVSGITNLNCVLCEDDYNGTFVLTFLDAIDNNCTWHGGSTLGCDGEGGPAWTLFYDVGFDEWAIFNESFEVIYAITGAQFDCCGPNTLPKTADVPFDCDNYPASVTITPLDTCSCVLPGNTCENAMDISIGETIGRFTLNAGSHWFKITHPGGNYKVTVNVNQMVNTANVDTYTGDCNSLVGDISSALVPGSNCDNSTQAAQDIWIQISTPDYVDYTIEFNLGTC